MTKTTNLPEKITLMSVENYPQESRERIVENKYTLALNVCINDKRTMLELDYDRRRNSADALKQLGINAKRLKRFTLYASMTIINRQP